MVMIVENESLSNAFVELGRLTGRIAALEEEVRRLTEERDHWNAASQEYF